MRVANDKAAKGVRLCAERLEISRRCGRASKDDETLKKLIEKFAD